MTGGRRGRDWVGGTGGEEAKGASTSGDLSFVVSAGGSGLVLAGMGVVGVAGWLLGNGGSLILSTLARFILCA